MFLREWKDLPESMQCSDIRKYYDALEAHKGSLLAKRLFDVVVSLIMLVILCPLFLIIVIVIVIDSPGGAFFRQVRITTYGRAFRIIKFRTMVANAERLGAQVTPNNDMRITRVGRTLRRYRLDEIPQLLNILAGDMTFVGTRPEVPRYIAQYTPEMLATLLLPAGVTSEASIIYKDEYKLLNETSDVDRTYVEEVLPGKMYYNLKAIEYFNFWQDIKTMLQTVFTVCGKHRRLSIILEYETVIKE